MKHKLSAALVLASLAILNSQLCTLHAQGTAFTYQGRLQDGANPANGNYDFTFSAWNAASGPAQVDGTLAIGNTAVSNGLFTVTLDFGNQFPGANRWLEIAVRTNGGGAFVTLAPRQQLTATPYAVTAGNVVSGGLAAGSYPSALTLNNAANQISGTFTGNGASVTNVNATTLGGVTGAGFWKTNGNTGANPANGTFLGTADNLPLEIKVNGTRALRLEPTPNDAFRSGLVNIIGGSPANSIAPGVYGSVIAGGGAQNYFGTAPSNSVAAELAFLGAGYGNSIGASAVAASLGGGHNNSIQANAADTFLGGGQNNSVQANASSSFLGGGQANTIQAYGQLNFLGGGSANSVLSYANYCFLGGGSGNAIGSYSDYSALAGGFGNRIATSSGWSVIGGGDGNSIQAYSDRAVLGGGAGNTIFNSSGYSGILCGMSNTLSAYSGYSVIGGGSGQTVLSNSFYATLPGGFQNAATNNALAAGTRAKAIHSGAFVWADLQNANFVSTRTNEFAIRAAGGMRLLSNRGLALNADNKPIITRGWDPFDTSSGPDKAGLGRWGLFMEPYNLVLGIPAEDVGNRSFQVGKYSTNGTYTQLMRVDQAGTVTASSLFASSAGGGTAPQAWINQENTADYARLRFSVGMGTGWDLVVPAGVTPSLTFYSGQGAVAYLNNDGALYAQSFNPTSDRNAKENFKSVSPREVLEKVAALPISEWNFKTAPSAEHIGPMAQDFYAAFGTGSDDKHIATVDADGVALAAIQGLNQKVEERSRKLEAENAELKKRLERLERLLNHEN